MARIALCVEYDGSRYHGWQTQQEGVDTVQLHVEQALAQVANHKVMVVCAGRTDKGVHATGQIVHFDSDAARDMKAWVAGGNSNLPADICLRWAVPVSDDFHARFRAMARSYRYIILNRPIRPALLRDKVTWTWRPLAVEPMQQASAYLLGTHDFSAFRGIDCQAKTPIKTMHSIDWQRQGEWLVLNIRASAFLQHMVRNIAGVMMEIGSGRKPVEWAKEVLESRDRRCGGVTAPPFGLYLNQVDYPAEFVLPREQYWPEWLPEALVNGWQQVEESQC